MPSIGLIADTAEIAPPASVHAFSSHLRLWESIGAELHAAPLAAARPDAYLADRARAAGVDPGTLDAVAFLNALIFPAHLQGVARLLAADGLPVRLWGTGWDQVPDLACLHRGAVDSAAAFSSALATSTALVRPTLNGGWHPVDACGRPVLDTTSGSAPDLVRRARQCLTQPSTATPAGPHCELADAIHAALASA